ncbi:unnamed protein product [Mesocestoides corti]|uniref:Uncharacterized protein n=1 Tax=Mesocestoides corti TaxID=53468 RepID=A0A0R3UC35_MESCO|nr:unnamed protein product [Mesocestoides corti]
MADIYHIGTQSLVKSNQHFVVMASCDREHDFRQRGVKLALNYGLETESQSAHEFCVSLTVPRNGQTEEHDYQHKGNINQVFPLTIDQFVTYFSLY